MHLRGIQTLDITLCSQATIPDAAFVHLRGIQKLDMNYSKQNPESAFVHLREIQTFYCNQATITASAIAQLVNSNRCSLNVCIIAAALLYVLILF